MEIDELVRRPVEAAEEFNRHEHRSDGTRVTHSLANGLTTLCHCLFSRLHADVERKVGRDSVLVPVSEVRAEKATKREIEIFEIAVSASAVKEHHYVSTDDDWYVQWLVGLRMGKSQADAALFGQIARYLSKTSDERRLAFTDALMKVLPESMRAPLIVFHLMPLAVRLVTALAFNDQTNATRLRDRQVACLPSIADCPECRGRLLDNGEQCRECGNPLWKFEWLTATD